MPLSKRLHFDDFQLDLANARLSRNGRHLPLTPKAFELLTLLCRRSGELVSKEEMLDQVWRRRFVSEGVLKNTIGELRQALGDTPKAPRYIETLHRRGYRFIGALRGDMPAPAGLETAEAVALVGRAPLLQQLSRHLQHSLAGQPATVFLRGEPGIGKTTLIQSFLRTAASPWMCIQGQCVEQYGQCEPYLPLLEAIGQLSRQGGEECIQALRRCAPTWLAQLPWLIREENRDALQRETQGVSKERMLRELGEFLRHWTEAWPLLLVLEDLHWSDRATVDAVTYLSRRRDGMRLMILGSYRPADVAVNEHPFPLVRDELLLHGLCHDLPLPLLALGDVDRYLRGRFSGMALPDSLVQAVFRRTEGLPLFLARIADEIAVQSPAASASGELEQTLAALPEGLRHLIDYQFDRLSPLERQWLDAAAVCGDRFSAATLAQASATALWDTEDWCEKQVRQHHLLRRAESSAEHYAFIHAYYQELAYARIPPARKTALHGRIGESLESACGMRACEQAAELALHFEKGRQYEKAADYFQLAAQNALNRHATQEAAQLLQNGIALLDQRLPDTLDNQRRLLDLLTRLPPALIASKGYAAAELPAIYQRTLELAKHFHDLPIQYFTLYRTWTFHCVRGELANSLELARQLAAMAENQENLAHHMTACFAVGTSLLYIGDNQGANTWLERGLAFAEQTADTDAYLCQAFGQDPHASLLAFQGITQHMLGFAERAEALMRAARERATMIGHPYTQAFILYCTVWLYRTMAKPEKVREYLPLLEHLSSSHGFPTMLTACYSFSGWAKAYLDGDPEGVKLVGNAIELLNQTSTYLTKPIYYHQFADICFRLGLYQQGLEAVDTALQTLALSGERRHEAETHRLRGELLLRLDPKHNQAEAKNCFAKALAVASKQNALLFQLRAACSLVRLHRDTEQQTAAFRQLRDIFAAFSEGFDSPDLQEAKTLLGGNEMDIAQFRRHANQGCQHAVGAGNQGIVAGMADG